MKNRELKLKNNTIIHLLIIIIFTILTVIVAWKVSIAYEDYIIYKTATFEKEEATIVEYKRYVYYTNEYFSTFYKYESPTGAVYTGCWDLELDTEEEAQAMLGKKVPVYYSEELGICDTSTDISLTGIIIGGIVVCVFILCVLNSLIREILFIVRWKRYKSYSNEKI